jgi:Zn-dependent M28 family amino/carboxypeptidase
MRQLTIRWRRVALVIGLLLFLVALSLLWMSSVPGRSFAGPSSDPEVGLRTTLLGDVTALAQEIGERNVRFPAQLAAAQSYIESELRAAGLTPTLEAYTAMSVACANVIAEVNGTSRANEIVVIGAHYDSYIGSPGANDNATGVAAMLALARRFAPTRPVRTLRFIAFANEEPPFFETGLMGSRVNARASRARGDDIVAMLSLETLGCYSDESGSQSYPSPLLRLVYPSRGNFVAFVSDIASRPLLRHVVGTFREHARIASEGGALPNWVSGVGWSDHRSYWLEGWPAVMVTDTAVFRDTNYHRGTDSVEHVDFRRLALAVEGLVHVVDELANPTTGI